MQHSDDPYGVSALHAPEFPTFPRPLAHSTPEAPPHGSAHTQREAFADEAIRTTAEHWVQEQARREALRRAGEPVPGDYAPQPDGSLEFVTGAPKYVLREVLLLAFGLFGAVPLMSSFALTALLSGCVVTYAADFAGYRRGSVAALIGTTALFGVALFMSNLHALLTSIGPLSMMLSVMGLLTITTMAALLHFRWLQCTFPELICVMERCVLGVSPLLALPSLLSSTTALVGSRHAPAWFLLIMCILHRVFYSPLESSFVVQQKHPRGVRRNRRDTDNDDEMETHSVKEMEAVPLQANGRIEAMIFTALLVLLPAVIYIAFQSNLQEVWYTNALNTLGMLCVPIVYLCVDPKRSLWFFVPDQPTLQQRLEYDPLGVQEAVGKYRRPFLLIGVLGAAQWAIYRILHSRYRYLFNGVQPPLNTVFLTLAMYTGVFALFQLKKLLDADSRGEKSTSPNNLKERAILIILACASCIFISIAAGIPGPFCVLSLLSITSLNFFLMDRFNTGPMISFTVFSSLLLLWWMYRTFSFIVMELHVLGESTTVMTPVVVVSVLWCYVLSCVALSLAFTKTKAPFVIALFLHSLQVSWVEHILYSQKEENVYPAVLVLFTSAVGVFLAARLYKNEAIDLSAAALISASYIAKLPTFVTEVTGSYYVSESDAESYQWYHAVEITGVWWAALIAGYAVVMFELSKGKQMTLSAARRLTVLFVMGSVGVSLFTARNFQRATYEFVAQSRLTGENSVHLLLGNFLIFLSLVTYSFFTRHVVSYAFMHRWLSLARGAFALGIILFISQPTRIMENDIALEYDLINENMTRYFTATGLILVLLSRILPVASLHLVFRAIYWLFTTGCLTLGLALYILPVPTFSVFVGVCGFMFFLFLTIDVSHYRKLEANEAWIFYGLSICFMVFTFFMLGRVDVHEYAKDNVLLMWEIYVTGRKRLLSFACVSSLFTAITLKFRLSGKSLFPGSLPITETIVEQVGLAVNYSTMLSVTTLTSLNLWTDGNEPALNVATSLFLLLLVDDGVFFSHLGQGQFRYFPSLLFAVAVLTLSLIYEVFALGTLTLDSFLRVFWALLCAIPVIPSIASLFVLLWFGRKRGGTPLPGVIFFVVLDLFCLLLSSSKPLQWLAIIGICGQCARLFEVQFLKRRLEMVL